MLRFQYWLGWWCLWLTFAAQGQVKYTSLSEAKAQNPETVEYIDLSAQNLKKFPSEVLNFPNLRILVLNNNQLNFIPTEISRLQKLEILQLSNNKLTDLPTTLSQIPTLKSLELATNKFNQFPEVIFQLAQLQKLSLSQNPIKTIPPDIQNLQNLTHLYFTYTLITQVTSDVFSIPTLEALLLDHNQITSLSIKANKSLTRLSLENNKISYLPNEISDLTNLQILNLRDNPLQELPENIGNLTNLTELNLYRNALQTLPINITKLHNIKKMNLGGNDLANLPEPIIAWLADFTFDLYNPTVKKQINEYNKTAKVISPKNDTNPQTKPNDKPTKDTKNEGVFDVMNQVINTTTAKKTPEKATNNQKSTIKPEKEQEGATDGGEEYTSPENTEIQNLPIENEVKSNTKENTNNAYNEVIKALNDEINTQCEKIKERNIVIEKEISILKKRLNDNPNLSDKEKQDILAKIKALEQELQRNEKLLLQLQQYLKNELANIEKRIRNDEQYAQNWIFSLFAVVLILFIGILIIAFIARMRKKQKEEAEKILALIRTQKQEIQQQHQTLTRKTEELDFAFTQIRASLFYARRIQASILEKPEIVLRNFTDGFIFYLPKDIVSGDFYWFSRQKDQDILAVVDCTGHGVPGAFMTMMGNLLLNEIVNQEKQTSPSIILQELDKRIRKTLRQENNQADSVQDGMDVVIINIDKTKKILTFASAKSHFYLIQEQKLQELKGTHYPIGSGFNDASSKTFPETIIPLIPEQVLYLFSDGFQDQLGGKKGRKFMKKRFRELLWENYQKPFEMQYQILRDEFEKWQGEEQQTDDILIIGVKLST